MKMIIKKTQLLILPLVVYSSDVLDVNTLFEDINSFSNETKVNIDYKPSFLTVLYSKDLRALGIRTLEEALNFITGVETVVKNTGAGQIILRGNAQPNNMIYEKVKFFIDGVDINFHYNPHFPIELIERIEILKGNSSALYGQGAFLASINIVTKSTMKNSDNFFSLEGGSFNSKKSVLFFNKQINDWFIGFDSSYQSHNRRVNAPSGVATTEVLGFPFLRKKESLEGIRDKNIGFNIKNKNLSLTSRYIESYTQNYYGFFGLLDFNDEGYSKYTTKNIELSYKKYISNNFSIGVNAGVLNYNYQLNTYIYKLEPNEFGFYDPHYKIDYTVEDLYTKLYLNSQITDKYKIDFDILNAKSKVPENDYFTNADMLGNIGFYEPITNAYYPISDSLSRLNGKLGIINLPHAQYQLSYHLRNNYSINENLNFSFDIRFDDYDFFDSKTSYSLSSVYSKDNRNIFKFSFAKGYHLPSFYEAYLNYHLGINGNPSLKSESIDSFELHYVYNSSKDKFKINTYYNVYKNDIDIKESSYVVYDKIINKYVDVLSYEYYNNPNREYNYGVEFEYIKNFENRSKLILNANYTKFKYSNRENRIENIDTPLASKVKGNFAYIYPLNRYFTLSTLIKYYGEKNLLMNNKIKPSLLFDSKLMYQANSNFNITLASKNIFDTKYFYYGYQAIDEKMQREGRTWYISLNYEF